jgi:hypothetical protein
MAFDPNDPRVKALLQALQGQGGGKPMFGGMARVQGGQSLRGRADYFKPGFAGINYNPLSAQMANGAPGLLGLNSGHDSNPPTGIPAPGGGGPVGAPVGQDGVAPPVTPHPYDAPGLPAPYSGPTTVGSPGAPSLSGAVQTAANSDPTQTLTAAQQLLASLNGTAPDSSWLAAGQGHISYGPRRTGFIGEY